MAKTMADYLPVKLADYSYTLSISPQSVMPQEGDKKQVVYEYDDGTVAVVTLAQQSQFNIQVQWELLSNAEADDILDLYHDPNKANGRARTWGFYHPIDGRNYIVRFMTQLTQTLQAGFVNHRGVPQITLRVEGERIVADDISQAQVDTLVTLYNEANGDNWTTNTNWMTDPVVSNWKGVTVVGGHVTKIELPENNLSGNAADLDFSDLTALEVLDLTKNLGYVGPEYIEAIDGVQVSAVDETAFVDRVVSKGSIVEPHVETTYAASGSSGMVVANDPNINFGTGDFTLVWRGSLPDWTPGTTVSTFIRKFSSGNGCVFEPNPTSPTGRISLYVGGGLNTRYISTVDTGAVDGTVNKVAVVVVNKKGEVDGTIIFYVNGVQLGDPVSLTAAYTSIDTATPLHMSGRDTARAAANTYFAATYNRALSAQEVADLYEHGIAESDKWGSQDPYIPGCTLALEPSGIRKENWLDSSSNVLNASYPATGATPHSVFLGNHGIELQDTAGRLLKGVLGSAGSGEVLGENKHIPENDHGPFFLYNQHQGCELSLGVGNNYTTDWMEVANGELSRMKAVGFGEALVRGRTQYKQGSNCLWYKAFGEDNDFDVRFTFDEQGSGIRVYYAFHVDPPDDYVDFLFAKILAPSRSGALITNNLDSIVESWQAKDGDFAYNQASYRITIKRLRSDI